MKEFLDLYLASDRESFFLAPVRVLRLFMVLPRESHSNKIRSKNKLVYGNAVTGIWCSLVPLLIDSCFRPHSSKEVISRPRKTIKKDKCKCRWSKTSQNYSFLLVSMQIYGFHVAV